MNEPFVLIQDDATIQAILSKMQPFAASGNAGALGSGYGYCLTPGDTAAKTVSLQDFILTPGAILAISFDNAFTVSSPTLSINGSVAKPINLFGSALAPGKVKKNTVLVMEYSGTAFNVIAIQSEVAPAPSGFVDLGLPSGLLWCEHNIGAATPYEHGLYFSWGNVIGHAEGSGYNFDQTTYDGTPGAALSGNIPVNTTYDAARHNMGAPCRLPTVGEFQELNNNCDSEWTDEDGVAGRRFTSRRNGNSIFFPASGYYNGTSLFHRGSYGYYWSASLYSATLAYDLNFYASGVNPANSSSRRYGFTARAVQ